MMEEVWKDIKGFEGRYQVSNLGRVKSMHKKWMVTREHTGSCMIHRNGRILQQIITRWGYCRVNLVNGPNIRKICAVHRLVAETFIPNPNNYECVNHKDENKLNNHVDNLEWCTFRYNDNFGTRNRRITEKVNRQRMKPVIQLDLNCNLINTFESVYQASVYTGLSRRAIWSVCNNKRKSHRGFIFKYKK